MKGIIKLKIVHLLTTSSGGAYQAAKRLDKALREIGIDSNILVLKNLSNEKNVEEYFLNNYWLGKAIRKVSYLICKKFFSNNKGYDFSKDIFGAKLLKDPLIVNADIVHIHWISNFITNKEIYRLHIHGKKICWTLHDMWPFTGGCFYDKNCQGYIKSCQNCKIYNDMIRKKAVEKNFRNRRFIMMSASVYMIGCSKWITFEAKKSNILPNEKIINIPNIIDTREFRPVENIQIKEKYGIKNNMITILVGAMNPKDDRKGYKFIKEIINKIDSNKYQLIVFGDCKEFIPENNYICRLGRIEDIKELNLIYNIADVFLAPSVQENLANTVLEAMAAGVPVVAFNIGGMSDMILHLQNGYLAKKESVDDLYKGIKYCTGKHSEELRISARKYVCEKFESEKIVRMHLELYERM